MKIISSKEENKIKELKEENLNLKEYIQELQEKLNRRENELFNSKLELESITSIAQWLLKENGKLKKYYELDKEPSDEIKIKIVLI